MLLPLELGELLPKLLYLSVCLLLLQLSCHSIVEPLCCMCCFHCMKAPEQCVRCTL